MRNNTKKLPLSYSTTNLGSFLDHLLLLILDGSEIQLLPVEVRGFLPGFFFSKVWYIHPILVQDFLRQELYHLLSVLEEPYWERYYVYVVELEISLDRTFDMKVPKRDNRQLKCFSGSIVWNRCRCMTSRLWNFWTRSPWFSTEKMVF